MVILTLNCGSSSIKFQLYAWEKREVLAVGKVERIGLENPAILCRQPDRQAFTSEADVPSHREALKKIFEILTDPMYGILRSLEEIDAVGHRVLHGGERIKQSAVVTPELLADLKALIPLGPVHMPANIMGIEVCQSLLPHAVQAVIPDTAWHQTMEETAFLYTLPYEWYEKFGIRRYGFHGASYIYCARRAAVLLGKKPDACNLIICHVGNGASVCAVRNGKSVDTSMGFTPLEGIVMGTRAGDMDPAIVTYMEEKLGKTPQEMNEILNNESGLLGICGYGGDRRDIQAAIAKGDRMAALAAAIECHRLKKYIGAYRALLGQVDAIVFTAGVGEEITPIREGTCRGLESIGICMDYDKNKIARCRNAESCISTEDSPTRIFVIPTNEELVMTEDVHALWEGTYSGSKMRYSFEDPDFIDNARFSAMLQDFKAHPEWKEVLAIPPDAKPDLYEVHDNR
ncbi:MAG: acetate kinase [Oscillospiraceae bacterium]|nr:acetate kinase [Oscillospiraceae bacterium]